MKAPITFEAANVLIMGDIMLDRYWSGDTRRISPEAPTPVVRVTDDRVVPGGAANVAQNCAALGGHPTLIGLLGDDSAGEALERELSRAVSLVGVKEPNLRTIEKLRILSLHQQLIRLDFEDLFYSLSEALKEKLKVVFTQALDRFKVVVFSDYGKGTLSEIQSYIQAAREKDCMVIVDPKGRDFSRYRGATLITPNLKEFEEVMGPCEDNSEILMTKALALIHQEALSALLVTQGAKGMTLIQQDGTHEHFPAKVHEVFDVTGAGDTVISTVATSVAAGSTLSEAVRLSSIAASIVVGKLGTATVSADELNAAVHFIQLGDQRCLEEQALLTTVLLAHAAGETIVMTNGCFDVLHVGHVEYLKQARQLGDRLIVAVNSDESVKRLKGDARPINDLRARMEVLAALSMVDWVVAFSEDTPQRLIKAVKPDVLVKGGDYTVEQIAGAESVLAAGGCVEIIDFVPGYSSSKIIEAL